MAPLEGLCRWMRKYRAGYSHPGNNPGEERRAGQGARTQPPAPLLLGVQTNKPASKPPFQFFLAHQSRE